MRCLLIFFLLCSFATNAQKSGVLEEAIGYAGDYDYRLMSKGSLTLEEEKKTLQDIERWLTKLTPYISSKDLDEKMPAVWAATHFYRQASFIYSFFNDSNDVRWNEKALAITSDAINFKNKFYKPVSIIPLGNNVDVTFTDTAFIDAALNAYAAIIATNQKQYKKAVTFLSKLPIKPVTWQDDEAPIAKAYIHLINASFSADKKIYINLLKLLNQTGDWFDFKPSEMSRLISNLTKNTKMVGYQTLLDYSALIIEKSDIVPENWYTLYTTGVKNYLASRNHVIKLEVLQQKIGWEAFTLNVPAENRTTKEMLSLIDHLLITLKKNYPLEAPPKINGKEDPALEILTGISDLISGSIPEEKLLSFNAAFEKHLEEPYSKAAAKAIAAIKLN